MDLHSKRNRAWEDHEVVNKSGFVEPVTQSLSFGLNTEITELAIPTFEPCTYTVPVQAINDQLGFVASFPFSQETHAPLLEVNGLKHILETTAGSSGIQPIFPILSASPITTLQIRRQELSTYHLHHTVHLRASNQPSGTTQRPLIPPVVRTRSFTSPPKKELSSYLRLKCPQLGCRTYFEGENTAKDLK